MSKFTYYHRDFFQEDLEEDFYAVSNPTPYKRRMPDGVYQFRTSRGERTTYYVCNNIWYFVKKDLNPAKMWDIVERNLLPCKKESEWAELSEPRIYKYLSTEWKVYVDAWKWLSWRRDLRIEFK